MREAPLDINSNPDLRQQTRFLQQVNSYNQKPWAKTISVFNDSKHTQKGSNDCGNAYICKALGTREVSLTRPPYIKIWAASSSRVESSTQIFKIL